MGGVDLKRAGVLALRMRRQGLDSPVEDAAGYEQLFRRLQPVGTGKYARPGSPPALPHRTHFDDAAHADGLRASRQLVKGRFQGGGVGYVWREDLGLYANAYARPLEEPVTGRRGVVLEAVRDAGPLTPRQLRDETGLLAKQVMPALQRLQEAFLVYEDQVDEDWERSWYEFGSEWPDVRIDPAQRDPATLEVVQRAVWSLAFATLEQLRDLLRLPRRCLETALREAERAGVLLATAVEGLGDGWWDADGESASGAPAAGVRVMDLRDPLARAFTSEAKRRYEGRDLLQLLWLDGELAGAVCGRWGFNPYDVEDVIVERPRAEREARREEIVAAVTRVYPEPRHRVLRYAGRPA